MKAKPKCVWGKCGRDADCQVGIKLWALSMPRMKRNEGNCIKMIHSVLVCEECRPNVKAEHFLLPEGKERITSGLLRAGKDVPDFAAAELYFIDIIDKPIDIMEMIRTSGGKVIEA